ncbi:MAG: FAD:protein FMN transferase [Burkholderiaceae bacterium]
MSAAPTGLARCRPALGTLVRVALRDDLPHDALLAAIDAAFAAIEAVERAMSFHRMDSDLSRLNAAPAGATLALDPGLVEVLRFSRELHELSDGVFDPGVADRLVAWDVLPRRTAARAPVAGSATSIRDVEILDAGHVRVLRATCLDLGGIAKGFAVDRAIEALRAHGIAQADVDAGGDLRVLGAPRPVHVRLARDPARPHLLGELGDGAIATSSAAATADDDGRAPSAFVDARSRARVVDERSFSVLASTCIAADALTKVLAIAGALPAGAARWRAQGVVL